MPRRTGRASVGFSWWTSIFVTLLVSDSSLLDHGGGGGHRQVSVLRHCKFMLRRVGGFGVL